MAANPCISAIDDDGMINNYVVCGPLRTRAKERASMLMQTSMIVGTPYYMAPELGDGSKNAQPPSDMFSMGVIAFELLTGTRPYAFPPVLGGVIGENVLADLRQVTVVDRHRLAGSGHHRHEGGGG